MRDALWCGRLLVGSRGGGDGHAASLLVGSRGCDREVLWSSGFAADRMLGVDDRWTHAVPKALLMRGHA